jgi:hypothetical protein
MYFQNHICCTLQHVFNTLIFLVMNMDHLTCAICFDETLILTCDIMTHLVNQMLSIEHFKWSKV